jgi:hypothetical protein
VFYRLRRKIDSLSDPVPAGSYEFVLTGRWLQAVKKSFVPAMLLSQWNSAMHSSVGRTDSKSGRQKLELFFPALIQFDKPHTESTELIGTHTHRYRITNGCSDNFWWGTHSNRTTLLNLLT